MKIIHAINDLKAEKEANENVSFLLTNKIGGFLMMSDRPRSRYQGFFYHEPYNVYKVIEDIHIRGQEILSIKNNFFNVERKGSVAYERFFIPHGYNTLLLELDNPCEVEVTLDVRQPYDNREWGRHYNITEEDGMIVITFTKKTDKKEDATHDQEEYTLYVVILGDHLHYQGKKEWVKRFYPDDKERNSMLSERYVFKAVAMSGRQFAFAVNKEKHKAMEEAQYIFQNQGVLKNKQKEYYSVILYNRLKPILKKIKNKEHSLAFYAAIHSIDRLTVWTPEEAGIYAGLPWFFQFWHRDEAVSLKALMMLQRYDLVKRILWRHLQDARKDGRIHEAFQHNNKSYKSCADALGWSCKRLQEFIEESGGEKKDGKKKGYLHKKEVVYIAHKVQMIADGLLKHHTHDSLEASNAEETWMDSLLRKGYRIEIQALRLDMYKFLHALTKNKKYRKLEQELKTKVKGKFWKPPVLADGTGDFTIRPNIFLAYYIYPELLGKEEWQLCFEKALSVLWLKWGGLSTISQEDEYFVDTHSGEDPKSYHNGDSWFWINNLAALCLYNLDKKNNKKKFKGYISAILQASMREILWKGCIGHHAELSSAKEYRSQGCLAQAWSSALYSELVKEVYTKNPTKNYL